MTDLTTIADAVATHARLMPDRLAARDSTRSLTWLEWHQRVCRLASSLHRLGLQKGERVAVIAYNRIEWLEIYVTLARAGLVAVPINFRLTESEMAYIMEHAEIAAVISSEEFSAGVDRICDAMNASTIVRIGLPRRAEPLPASMIRSDQGDQGDLGDWHDYEALIEDGFIGEAFEAVCELDPCALMYTSGTTGKPKAVIRLHRGSSLIALATALEFGFTQDEVALLVMPLCHANSLYFATTMIHRGGVCIVEDRSSFDPEALLAKLALEKVTFTSLVPTHYIMVLGLPDAVKQSYDVSRVGKLLISSAPARRDTKLGILAFFSQCKLFELYGSTEAGWVTMLRPEEQLSKLGSVGREWFGSAPIRLLDESKQEVADGEVGELFSRTPYAFEGYWKDEVKTAEAFDGAWCSVGDMARRDAEGYIWLVDRKSNMIISGGENIYPSEVEAVIGAHPTIKDVAVIGIPHEKWGEAVMAVVVLHQDMAFDEVSLRSWCRKHLAGFKSPSAFKEISEQDMPRTATGKILHRSLRGKFQAEPSNFVSVLNS